MLMSRSYCRKYPGKSLQLFHIQHDQQAKFSFRWQHERGDQTMVISQTRRAESICQTELVDDEWHRIDLMSNTYDLLSCYANATNDAQESMTNSRRFLELRQQIATKNGCDDGYLAYAYNQLGIAFTMENNYLRAMELFKKAIEIWHSLPTYEPGIASMEYANLGLALLELGHVKEASQNLEEGLREREAKYGKDDAESFKFVHSSSFFFAD